MFKLMVSCPKNITKSMPPLMQFHFAIGQLQLHQLQVSECLDVSIPAQFVDADSHMFPWKLGDDCPRCTDTEEPALPGFCKYHSPMQHMLAMVGTSLKHMAYNEFNDNSYCLGQKWQVFAESIKQCTADRGNVIDFRDQVLWPQLVAAWAAFEFNEARHGPSMVLDSLLEKLPEDVVYPLPLGPVQRIFWSDGAQQHA